MSEELTMADFDMIDDALFQRAADAKTVREEGRWLHLRRKVARMALVVERAGCACGHARKSHRGNGRDRCIICQCVAFDQSPDQTDGGE